LLNASYDFKARIHDIVHAIERPGDWNNQRAREVIALYDQITASGVKLLIDCAEYWIKHTPGTVEAMKQLRAR
jgi:adenosyl cobinamide kinase/adenosyl cobinamide phosphate guanylyltransferase